MSAPAPRGQASQEDVNKRDDAAARLKAEKDANEASKKAEQEAAVKLKEANEAKLKAQDEAKVKSGRDATAKLEAEREAASSTEILWETSGKSEAVVADVHIFRKVAEAVDELKTTQGSCAQESIAIDAKYKKTPQEIANDEYIRSRPNLFEYKEYIQKTWNELFLAAALMSSGKFKLDTLSDAEKAGMSLKYLSQSMPVVCAVMYAACGAYDKVKTSREKGGFVNLCRLNPSSDVVLFGNLAEYIACECSLEYHKEIEDLSFVKAKDSFTRLKSKLISAVSKVDDKFARGFFSGVDMSDNQCVALDHARISMSKLMNMNAAEIDSIAGDKLKISEKLLEALRDEYTSSGRAQVSVDSTSVHVATSGGGGGGVSISAIQQSEKTKDLEIDALKKKVEDAEKKAEDYEKIILKTQRDAKEARETALRNKSILDAFVDTSGVGADGHVQAALRNKDGSITVQVESPQMQSQVNEIAAATDDRMTNLEEENRALKERLERMEQQAENAKKKKKKKMFT